MSRQIKVKWMALLGASLLLVSMKMMSPVFSFVLASSSSRLRLGSTKDDASLSMSEDWSEGASDPNKWTSSSRSNSKNNDGIGDDGDWATPIDGTAWSTFESIDDEEGDCSALSDSRNDDGNDFLVDDSEAWLDTLQAISAEEIEFNQRDNERAEKALQMKEWGFDDTTIANTFGVAVDDSREKVDEPSGLAEYRKGIYDELGAEYDEENDSIESHTRVEIDPDTGEPIRQQMVYVDEHACIGCTNCATIAQSTFFMESGFGRARVYQQWGDTDETVATAIETCPVDCIHYVPYEELVTLEKDRRGQKINNQARLVNQGESAHMASTGSSSQFTAPQTISGNASARCSNCPTRGCKTCPMFGVGKNPEYERREALRKANQQRRRLERQRADESKSADL
ncbi:unnamed protein product [Pseudo-nitzschia multistriata]|uniref:Uncharacterized protein n=1 Tax=Pseudo-nitzschia multistriata TaxID=183589 RepID=A0A448Z963_9STRA|nr:unnamed protein product [Pseudo-nitzschia multistriata]